MQVDIKKNVRYHRTSMNSGRKDRKGRLMDCRSGSWASSSQDYLRHATKLYEHSAAYARSIDGNCSPYALSGLPILFSALRAMLIEANSGMYGLGRDQQALNQLANAANEIPFLANKYRLCEEQTSYLSLLYEARNEIIHPSHMPAGTSHGTPFNMIRLRDLGLLQSTGTDNSDYTWISQLQSHKLFRGAFAVIEEVATIVLKEHHPVGETLTLHIQSYARYREYDL